VIGRVLRLRPFDLADARHELHPVEPLSVFADRSGRVPLDLYRQRGGQVGGVSLGDALSQRQQRRARRPNGLAGPGEFQAVLDRAGELVEVHATLWVREPPS